MVGSANSSRGDSNDNHAIPSINITTDSSTPALIISPDDDRNVSTWQSPVSAGLLSPISYNPRSSYDAPPSPAFSDTSDAASALTTPPSPTLSNHSSVHFQSSLALRDNKPEQKSGMSSLGLLNPDDASTSGLSHHRKLSNATFSSTTETEGDHAYAFDLRHMKSNATSFTHVDSHSVSRGSHKKTDSQEVEHQERKPKIKGEHEADGEYKTAHQKELAQDEAIDCTPFAFKPFQLAHMLDPKSVDILASFGGTSGLLRGLGTSADHGLTSPPHRTETVSEPGVLGAGEGASHRHDPEKGGGNDPLVPQIRLTEPNGGISSPTESEHPAAQATFEDRRRVYGENTLPQRASKTLLQLMWMALKDKVLVWSHLQFFTYECSFGLVKDSLVDCCHRFSRPRSFSGLETEQGYDRSACRLGGRCGHHGRYCYRCKYCPHLVYIYIFKCCFQGDCRFSERLAERASISSFKRKEGGAWGQGHTRWRRESC